MLALRLPETIESRLTTLAKITGRTKSFYAKEAILKHLEELEARYLPQQPTPSPMDKNEYDRWFKEQVEAGIDEMRSGRTISHEQVKQNWVQQREDLIQSTNRTNQ